MKPSKPIHLVSTGVVCSVGGTAPVATAAIRARLNRFSLHPPEPDEADDENDDDESARPAHIARVGAGEPETVADDLGRMTAQLKQALAECLRGLGSHRGALPDALVAFIVTREPAAKMAPLAQLVKSAVPPVARLHAVDHVVAGHAGGMMALDRAIAALTAGEAQLALIAAADARTSHEAVAALAAEGRLLTLGRSFGFAPGEAAACVLLASAAVQSRLKLHSLARVVATGFAMEKNLRGGDTPVLGQGLTQAVRGALEGLPGGAKVANVYCDLNGERYRTDEWGFSLPRLIDQLPAPDDFISPNTSTGDVGAASGALLLAMAAADGRRGRNAGPHALLWTSADGGERAAVLLELGPADRVGAQRDRAAGKPFEALDGSMIEEMSEEGQFLYEHRLALLELLEEDPFLGWSRVGEVEGRLAAMVDGVVAGAERGRKVADAALAAGSPGGVYVGVAALAACESWDRLWQGLALAPVADPAVAAAAVLALEQALADHATAAELLAQGFARTPALATVVLEVVASLGLVAPPGVIAAVAAQAQGASASIRSTAALFGHLAGSPAGPIDPHWFPRWLEAATPEDRATVALAWFRAGAPAARGALGARSSQPWALMPFCLAGDATVATQMRALLAAPQPGPIGYRMLGLWGDPAAVPLLISRLDEHPDAGAAAEALELITGAGLIEEIMVEKSLPDDELNHQEQARRATGDKTAGIERKMIRRLDRRRAVWDAWWRGNASRFHSGGFFRAGFAASVAATTAALRAETLPLTLRWLLADELAIRHKVRTPFHPGQPVNLQQRWLAALSNPIH